MRYNLISNGSFKHGFDLWQVKRGEPTLTANKKLSCNEHVQLLYTIPSQVGHHYFIRFCAKLHVYQKGLLGYKFEGVAGESQTGFQQVSQKIQVHVKTYQATAEALQLTVGTFFDAQLEGEMISVEVYDLTTVYGAGNEPSTQMFRKQLIKEATEDQQAKQLFVETMNHYAKANGMHHSHFVNPSGLHHSKQFSTAKDLHNLLQLSAGWPAIQKIWNKPIYHFRLEGMNARAGCVVSTVTEPDLVNNHYVIGGKTGTIQNYKSLAVIVEHPKTKRWLASVICGTQGNRFKVISKLIDALVNAQSTEHIEVASAYITELDSTAVFTQLQKNNAALFEKNADTQVMPASITKLLTAVITVEYVATLQQSVMVKDSDLVGGSGQAFYEGDVVTIEQALHCMLLESSNTMANTVARVIGHEIKRLTEPN